MTHDVNVGKSGKLKSGVIFYVRVRTYRYRYDRIVRNRGIASAYRHCIEERGTRRRILVLLGLTLHALQSTSRY